MIGKNKIISVLSCNKKPQIRSDFLTKYIDYKIEFTYKEITPWSGVLMLKKMLDKMDFESCLDGLDLPRQGSNRGYSSDQLIKQFMTSGRQSKDP